jgi:adenine deaminase
MHKDNLREPLDLHDPALRDRAVRAARGQAPFDILLTGGLLVDVATGELRPADIGFVGPLIASVHERNGRSDSARVIDVSGKYIAPGLIDSHMHIESSMVTPRGYASIVVPNGVTTICWDPHEIGNVMGLDGVRWAINASRNLPLRVLVMAPSCVPSAPGLELSGADFDAPELTQLLSMPEVIGLAEVMDMRGVLERGDKMRRVVETGLQSGKLVCGHARGLAGADLQGFACAGIESDHEIVSGDDLLAKLRAGFTVELRGSHDYILPEAVTTLRALPRLPVTLTICTDDVFPDDLVAFGGLIDVLRRLIRYGMPALDAIAATTLHAALRLGRRDLGLVGAGRRADVIVLDDLANLNVRHVFASGRHVASNGQLHDELRADPVPLPASTMKLNPLTEEDFILRAPDLIKGTARMRTIVRPRFTQWGETQAQVVDGQVRVPDGKSLMAVIHRHARAAPVTKMAIIDEWGEFGGAVATTVSHDSHNLTIFGRNAADMAAAANALIACGGGMAVAARGKVEAELALPVCGLVSPQAPSDVAQAFTKLRHATDQIAQWKPPLRVFKALVGASLACNPGPHLTDRGLTDGTTGEIFDPFL